MTEHTIHHGRNIKRFRELFGIKQEALALELGDDWNQQRISLMEQKEEISDNILEEIAKVLKVPTEAIKNFDEQAALSFIGNTFTSHDNSATLNGYTINYSPNFNPIEKWMEALEQNKQLYERLLQTEREKVELLEKMLKERPF